MSASRNPHAVYAHRLGVLYAFNPSLVIAPEYRKEFGSFNRNIIKGPLSAQAMVVIRRVIREFLEDSPMPKFVFIQLLTLPVKSGAIESFFKGQIYRCLTITPHFHGRRKTPMEYCVTVETVAQWLVSNLRKFNHEAHRLSRRPGSVDCRTH